ncbi:MAG: thioesterase family protein [Deltaproteobacteria bacterium]|nr:thioesterase family protein [Deltaproteobacteria bacterium]
MDPHDLLADLAVSADPQRPGLYRAQLPDAWSFLLPSGGVLSALGLVAMERHLDDPRQTIISASTIFCEALRAGPLNVEVEVLRRGQAASQLRARVREGHEPDPRRAGLEVIATFACDREGPDVIGASFPEVKSFEASALSPEHKYRLPFLENFEDRLALGHLSRDEEWEAGPARYARWLRYKVPPRRGDGTLSPYALPPIADLMPPALLQLLGPTYPRFLAPSLDLTLHFLEDTTRDRVLVHSYCRRARRGYATAEVELWDEDRRLLAYGTQVMMLRRWPTPPSP